MQSRIKKAMVLAAGYGTRLKPLTNTMPKPLVPVAGKPMIEYALDRLHAYGIEEVVMNVSHLKEQLKAYVSACPGLRITLSEETEPLETGGGLKKALPLLGPVALVFAGPRLSLHLRQRVMKLIALGRAKTVCYFHDVLQSGVIPQRAFVC